MNKIRNTFKIMYLICILDYVQILNKSLVSYCKCVDTYTYYFLYFLVSSIVERREEEAMEASLAIREEEEERPDTLQIGNPIQFNSSLLTLMYSYI